MSNPEYKVQLRAVAKLLCVCLFALLYAWGGMEYKWLRRYLAPLWLCGSMWLFSRDKKVFWQAPLLALGLSLPYGASALLEKMLLRGVYGLISGGSALVQAIVAKTKNAWMLFWLHLPVCIVVTIVLGVWNITPDARSEELVIGFFYGLLPMYMVKDARR